MKKVRNIVLITIVIAVLTIGIIIANINKKNKINNNTNYKILTSFYPIYIMTLNITDGAQDIQVNNMAEKLTGCIHDYTLTTTDLKKFENADLFIQNGGGLESFSKKIIDSYPNIKVISGANNISNYIYNEEGESNSHIWLSIENYIGEVKTISEELEKINPQNSETYKQNSQNYIKKLQQLKNKYENLTNLKKVKAICLNESLQYLLKENNIEQIMIETDHEQSALSAEKIKTIIDEMNKENIKTIFIDKDDDSKTADTLAKETGAKVYRLNSEMNGENNKNAYIQAMEYNYGILKDINQK